MRVSRGLVSQTTIEQMGYEIGLMHRHRGKLKDCPFMKDTDHAHHWTRGWKRGRRQREQLRRR